MLVDALCTGVRSWSTSERVYGQRRAVSMPSGSRAGSCRLLQRYTRTPAPAHHMALFGMRWGGTRGHAFARDRRRRQSLLGSVAAQADSLFVRLLASHAPHTPQTPRPSSVSGARRRVARRTGLAAAGLALLARRTISPTLAHCCPRSCTPRSSAGPRSCTAAVAADSSIRARRDRARRAQPRLDRRLGCDAENRMRTASAYRMAPQRRPSKAS